VAPGDASKLGRTAEHRDWTFGSRWLLGVPNEQPARTRELTLRHTVRHGTQKVQLFTPEGGSNVRQ